MKPGPPVPAVAEGVMKPGPPVPAVAEGVMKLGPPVSVVAEGVVELGPPVSVVAEGVMKPGPPLLRMNRYILAFFLWRGWSGFHAASDRAWRGWSGFHAKLERGRQGWSGFHAVSDRAWRGWPGFHAKLERGRQGWSGFHRGSDKGQGWRELCSRCDEETGTRPGRRFSECPACGETHHNGSGGGPDARGGAMGMDVGVGRRRGEGLCGGATEGTDAR